jgi:Dolichyl-phosphate-mannose-protein mannosyltransferase
VAAPQGGDVPGAVIRRDAFVVAAVVAGIALRVWVLASPLGTLDADEAIVGLMARHVLDGEFSVFYWGALYGGSQDAILAAAVFAVAGSSVVALKLVSVAIFAVAALLVWRIGRRTVGEPAARIGAALFWLWPPFLVWWSTKERGYFGAGLVLGLLALLLALRLRERDSRLDAAALGLVVGLGLWVTLQSWLLAAPAVAWLVWRRPAVLRLAWIALPAAVLGAAPWLAWNLRHDWNAVVPESVAGAESTYVGRFWDLFAAVLPTWLGLRVPYSLDWTLGAVVGVALLVLALAGFAFLLVRRPPGLEPLLVVAVAFPFLYAASSFTFLITEPRYLVFFGPVVALLLAHGLAARPRLAAAGLAAALALSIVGLRTLERQDLFTPEVHEGGVTAELGPLIARLEREGVDHVFANYWLAYRISFESDERVIATSTGHVRYEPHDRAVRSDPNAAHVFFAGAPDERRPENSRRIREGPFAIYVPGRLRIVVEPPSQTTS